MKWVERHASWVYVDDNGWLIATVVQVSNADWAVIYHSSGERKEFVSLRAAQVWAEWIHLHPEFRT